MLWTSLAGKCDCYERHSLRGREFLHVGELPRSPWCGGLSTHARHWRWRRSCKSLLCMSLTFIYDGNLKGSNVHATEIALSWDCAPVPHDLGIVHWCLAISGLHKFLDCAKHIYMYSVRNYSALAVRYGVQVATNHTPGRVTGEASLLFRRCLVCYSHLVDTSVDLD